MQSTVTAVLEILVAIVTLLAAVYGFTHFVDWRIEKKIHEESFTRKIASLVRPSMIFDENNSILVDQGGTELLETVIVSHDSSSKLPRTITVNPKRFLAQPPLMQTLDTEIVELKASRGEGFSWVYSLDYIMHNDQFDGRRRFRIEIV